MVNLACCRWSAYYCGSVPNNATNGVRRGCQSCQGWQALPRIGTNHCAWPTRLSHSFDGFTPGLWVIPTRCYWRQRDISEHIRRGSELFYRFKTGQSSLGFPLALAMYEALKEQQTSRFDCVVPIPLSPDKKATGQVDRTRILAHELATLLRVPVANLLSLKGPISKRQFLSNSRSVAHFEHRYHQLLTVDGSITEYQRILLLDDVCTQGSTLNCALRKITETHPTRRLTATTAGQMLLKSVVRDEHLILGLNPTLPF
jgi:predicted amidophosphoribosyltransferase